MRVLTLGFRSRGYGGLLLLSTLLPCFPLLAQSPALLDNAKPAVVLFEILDRHGELLREANGCIVTPEGVVLTTYDAIRGGYSAAVHISGHQSPSLLGVIGLDESHNLAVLKLSDPSLLPSALMGDAATVRSGQEVYAIHTRSTLDDAVVPSRVVEPSGTPSGEEFEVQPLQGTLASGDPLFDGSGHIVAVVGSAASGRVWRAVPATLAQPWLERGVQRSLREVTDAHTQESRLVTMTVVVPAHQVRTLTIPISPSLKGGDLELDFAAAGGLTSFIRMRLRVGSHLVYDSHRAAHGSFHMVVTEAVPLTLEWNNRGSLLLSRRVTTSLVVRQVH